MRRTSCWRAAPSRWSSDVPAIAVRALDRIVGDDSEWRELWEEAEESYPRALAGVRSIRDTLAQAITR
nr:hypothetical protein GCM10020092_056130 [Actinoplanes digitatis]